MASDDKRAPPSGDVERHRHIRIRNGTPGAVPLASSAAAGVQLCTIGKVHVAWYSFILGMMKAGVLVEVIRERLAHKSLETSAAYLPKLERAENPFAPQMAIPFGPGSKGNPRKEERTR